MRWQTFYPEWVEPLNRLSESEGTVLILGGTDVGKSTFSALLIRLWLERAHSIGFVDLDLGQTSVGPPGMLSWTLIRKAFERFSDLEPSGTVFVGDITPARHLTLALTGARRLYDEALQAQPDRIVIDSCGFISGTVGRQYKLMLCDLLRPRVIVALQREQELEPILGALRRRADWELVELSVPGAVGRKSPIMRSQYRRVAFGRYFQRATVQSLSLEQISFTGRRLGAGEPFSAQRLRYLSDQVGAELLHAEKIGPSLHAIAREPMSDTQLQLLMTLTGTDRLVFMPPNAYHHLLVGLIDYTGRHYGMGLIEEIDFPNKTLRLMTPVRSVQPVRWVQLGFLRVLPDGTELGEPLRDG
ncbi:MAG: Clp1/GlmU family protein [Fimbriimonadales bacterium]